jgi:hypothetical protein
MLIFKCLVSLIKQNSLPFCSHNLSESNKHVQSKAPSLFMTALSFWNSMVIAGLLPACPLPLGERVHQHLPHRVARHIAGHEGLANAARKDKA